MSKDKKLIFICTGNTCRSPLAESYAKYKYPRCNIESRGLTIYSLRTNELSLEIIDEEGLPKPASPKQLMAEDIDGAKLVAMTQSHKVMVESTFPRADVILLSELGNGNIKDIRDPIGGPKEMYQKTYDEIKFYIDESRL